MAGCTPSGRFRIRDFRNKRVLVTGAASGIGLALARALAAEGARLFLVDQNAQGLEAACQEPLLLRAKPVVHVADVRGRDALQQISDAIMATWGGLDLLVNNAGITYIGPTHEMTEDQWRQLIDTNLRAPVQLTRALLPLMLRQPGAHVLNIGSMAGLLGHDQVAYSLTKAALVGFSRSLRLEYGDWGLGVTVVCPGLVDTNLFRSALVPGGSGYTPPTEWKRLFISPDRVARTALDAIKRDRGVVVGSFAGHSAWLFKRLAPLLFERIFAKVLRPSRGARDVPSGLTGSKER